MLFITPYCVFIREQEDYCSGMHTLAYSFLFSVESKVQQSNSFANTKKQKAFKVSLNI